MIKNFNCCCNNNSCDPTIYVKVTNKGDLYIRFILQYSLAGQTFTHQIDLSRRRTKRYYIPKNSYNICLNILNISFHDTTLIHHECISGLENVCYDVKGLPQEPICIKVPC
ncbi:hypothetical protein FDJ70_09770 [Clostridium botulinum]|uniref:Uncharacterized protein n=2 Tax=Clostridium botulinum TaxID=1491 RepID=C4B697_CLOBO|nr:MULTISPECIES: hypothetical protein [Clostridium]ACT33583.1 hypothetical protein CLG_0128 [Clostridium botulinum D str. 1873]AYF55324.1 hypothetical protein DFH04_11375 [Clostridium novyi]MBO3442062.1 hypothetical protein [Clostridium haemolyticum]NFV47939.1 hypothetical protein [Clostridium botulinum]QPW56637.1 hypothetical protein IRP61_11585 [Clostridium botulinum]